MLLSRFIGVRTLREGWHTIQRSNIMPDILHLIFKKHIFLVLPVPK